MKIHRLKILPEYFIAVSAGYKTFEIRKNDRDFKIGDQLVLKEWNKVYTGRKVIRDVTYISDFKQQSGYVVIGIKPNNRS